MPRSDKFITDKAAYHREYNARYRALRGGKSSVISIAQFPEEPAMPLCAAFGCGMPLAPIESLAGRYHFRCSPGKNKVVNICQR